MEVTSPRVLWHPRFLSGERRNKYSKGFTPLSLPLSVSLAATQPKPSKMVAESKEAKLEIGEDGVNPELVACIEKLQEVQEELDRIDEEESEKVLEVERECNEKCRPIYVRRNEIIRSIPDFWLTAFLNHPALCELLNERDQKIFKHLVSLEVDDIRDSNSGYFIAFNFSANPYFENTTLTKTYSFGEGTTGTTIDWKEGMDIVNKVAQKKKGGKRPHAEESFFSWFSITQQRNISEGIFDDVGITIKEDIWPNPLKYFNNEVDEEEFNDKDDDDNEEKGTDDNEDEDGDDDDDAEEDEDDDD